MQDWEETEPTNELPSGLTRSVRLMAEERRQLGFVSNELKAMILDEELTPVLEVIVDQTAEAYGIVPRHFKVRDDDLIDPFGQSLKAVNQKGIEWSRQQVKDKVPGAWKELQRRVAEERNAEAIAAMPPGTLAIEISANPIEWTDQERAAQNYSGLTMLRLSAKETEEDVLCLNFILPNLGSPADILDLQNRLGFPVKSNEVNTTQLLANPKFEEFKGSASATLRTVDGLLGGLLLEKSLGHSSMRMLHRAIEKRREAWQFLNSAGHSPIHQELLQRIQDLSKKHEQFWAEGMAAIRSGFTYKLKQQFLKREVVSAAEIREAETNGGFLVSAAEQAVEAGEIYVACGMTVEATKFAAHNPNTVAGRAAMAAQSRDKITGQGACASCGASGSLYGCGLCSRCNKAWWDSYVATGKQTAINDLPNVDKDSNHQKNPTAADWREALINPNLEHWNVIVLAEARARKTKNAKP